MRNKTNNASVTKQFIFIISRVLFLYLSLVTTATYAQPEDSHLGQVIQINTRLRSFVGQPKWVLEIRDVDNNKTIPYFFDITRTNNHWTIFTYGRNYLIIASRIQMPSYSSNTNKYKNYRVKNFCQLESNGRIIKGLSMQINIKGDLSPNSNTYTCQISTYSDTSNFIYRKK